MKEKKFTPLMWCHLIMMAVLMVGSLVVAFILFTGATSVIEAGYETWKSSDIFGACVHATRALALCFGILYLVKSYRKNAAAFYKAFMLLLAVSNVFGTITLITTLITMQGNPAADVSVASNAQFILNFIHQIVKIALLLVLTFAQNLGKRNTWIVFYVLLAVDVIFNIFMISPDGYVMISATSSLSKLFMDGTIGLAIKGKYDDKDARGTV